jgi:hypothetical protein
MRVEKLGMVGIDGGDYDDDDVNGIEVNNHHPPS